MSYSAVLYTKFCCILMKTFVFFKSIENDKKNCTTLYSIWESLCESARFWNFCHDHDFLCVLLMKYEINLHLSGILYTKKGNVFIRTFLEPSLKTEKKL